MNTAPRIEFYTLKQVITKTSVSRTSIYDWSKAGTFPKARKLGARRVAWLASDVEDWIKSRCAAA